MHVQVDTEGPVAKDQFLITYHGEALEKVRMCCHACGAPPSSQCLQGCVARSYRRGHLVSFATRARQTRHRLSIQVGVQGMQTLVTNMLQYYLGEVSHLTAVWHEMWPFTS